MGVKASDRWSGFDLSLGMYYAIFFVTFGEHFDEKNVSQICEI